MLAVPRRNTSKKNTTGLRCDHSTRQANATAPNDRPSVGATSGDPCLLLAWVRFGHYHARHIWETHSVTDWILVDYENVQPADFDVAGQPDTRIFVFLGPKQKNIPAALADVPRPKADPAKRQVPSLDAVRQALVDAHNTRPRKPSRCATGSTRVSTRRSRTPPSAACSTDLSGAVWSRSPQTRSPTPYSPTPPPTAEARMSATRGARTETRDRGRPARIPRPFAPHRPNAGQRPALPVYAPHLLDRPYGDELCPTSSSVPTARGTVPKRTWQPTTPAMC